MDIYVADKNLNTIGIIDYCSSVIWTKRYFTHGDFEIVVPACKSALELLQKDNFLYRHDNDTPMIINKVQLQTNAETGDQLIVTGPSVSTCLSRRIVWAQTIINGTVASGIAGLLNRNAINPDMPERKIDKLSIGSLCVDAAKLPLVKQITGDQLDDAISGICKSYGIGQRIGMSDDRTEFLFHLYSGVDRSYAQTENSYVVFSEEFGNLLSSDYISDKSNYKNVAMVAGEGEGRARKKSIVGNAANWDRYEIFVDQRNLSSNDGEISESEYNAQLKEAGTEQLAEHAITESFESEIDPTVNYKYGVDYFLGDIVQIENVYGIQARARITEIIESLDESGHLFVPTFENVEV